MRTIKSFFADQDGASSLMFGLVAIPLMGAVGALSDYSTAADARTKLQVAVDAAGLKLTRNNNTLTDAQLQTAGDALVRSFVAGRADLAVSSVTATRASNRITVTAQGTVTARFSGMFSGTRTAVAATGQTGWGVRKIEIALVLDNTLSMNSNGKMAALKTAATNFINTMQAVVNEADTVKISIVPFNTTVKIGTSYAAQTWLTNNYLNASPNPYPRTSNPNNWDGCVMDRQAPNNVNDSAPLPGTLSTLYPKTMCPQVSLAALMPLSTDFNALRGRITAMTPAGYTNVTIGVVWGLATLSDQVPMSGGVAFDNPDVDKVMIVLTDGDNTQDRWSTSTSVIDPRTADACTAVKAKNIRVYTVRVINGNGTLLSNCATSPSMYYNVQNATELNPVFQAIANSIQKIRLTN